MNGARGRDGARGRGLLAAGDIARAFAVALPPALVAGWLVLRGELSPHAPSALGVALALSAGLAWWARATMARRLRTVTAVLAAYREGDFSIRARPSRGDAPLGDVLRELNQLGDTLREHRLGELEAWALLRKVMAEVDVVVLAIGDDGKIKLANDAALRVLGKPSSAVVGEAASALGLAALLSGTAPRIVRDSPFGAHPWELRRGAFRLSGEPHALIVLSDVGEALREQERDAWKRLIRVMGHEINNSLAPIQSIAESTQRVLLASPRADDWEQDVVGGLAVVSRRAEALGRFMSAYARLARLPAPKLGRVDVARWARGTAALETRVPVAVRGGPDVTLLADADQLDQLLINLVKNAAEATLERRTEPHLRWMLERSGGVRVSWSVESRTLRLVVEDDGPGVAEATSLFVPFFTTKPGGSGVGLALARQIAEAHGGDVSLRTRDDGSGSNAEVRLPIRA